MNDLTALLDRAAGPAPAPDVTGDLARGRRALARTRRRRGAAGLLGVAAASVVGVGAVRYADGPASAPRVVEVPEDVKDDATTPATQDASPTGVQLLAQPFEAGPYTFATTPEGWYVQGAYPQGVTIAPEGADLNPSPYSFEGKLVIMLDGHRPFGEPVTFAGREFWVRSSSGYTTIETLTRPGEPEGKLSVQFPVDTGWAEATMFEFLASVEVGPGAVQGIG
jgi:hypothetical protein